MVSRSRSVLVERQLTQLISPPGLLTSVQNIGGFIALPFAPYITDGLGRKKGIFVGGIIMLGGVALQAQAVNVTQFILARGLSESERFSFLAGPFIVDM